MKILIDTNVVLDLLMRRRPFGLLAAKVFKLARSGDVDAYISAHTVTTIDYVLRVIQPEQRRATLIRLLSRIGVATIDHAVVQEALLSTLKNFEDAVTHSAADAVGANLIVTRNVKDFSGSKVPALDPALFLAQITF